MATLDKMMDDSEITNMLNDSNDTDTEPIRGLIREVYNAFFGSSSISDNDKKNLLSKLTSGYGMDDVDESTYPYFSSAAIKITSIHKALAGADDATDV